jgi:hypothetical protein
MCDDASSGCVSITHLVCHINIHIHNYINIHIHIHSFHLSVRCFLLCGVEEEGKLDPILRVYSESKIVWRLCAWDLDLLCVRCIIEAARFRRKGGKWIMSTRINWQNEWSATRNGLDKCLIYCWIYIYWIWFLCCLIHNKWLSVTPDRASLYTPTKFF